MTPDPARPSRLLPILLLAGGVLVLPGRAQDQARDLRPLPDVRSPVGLAASPFHVWIATGGALSRWSRLSDDPPVWYGPGHDLPTSGISGLCWDTPSSTLRLYGHDGSTLVWSEASARAQVAPSRLECASSLARAVPVAQLPLLVPEPEGWLHQGTRLIEPGGRHARILQAIVIEDRELWLLTSNAGIWKGRWPSGRIAPMAAGLGETCIARAVRASDDALWMLGCSGNLARLASDGAIQAIDPRSPRWRELANALDLAPDPNGGVHVAVPGGVVDITASRVRAVRTGRKMPYGGSPLAVASLADTLWVLGASGVSLSIDDGDWTALPMSDTAGTTLRVLDLAPTRSGLLAGTSSGFFRWNGTMWVRPPELAHATSRMVRQVAVEPGTGRIAWSDGTRIWVDTLAGSKGAIGVWMPPSGTLGDFAWDSSGRLHIAHESWTIWNPADGQVRTWNLPVSSRIVVPHDSWTFVGGNTGGVEARTDAWAP